MKIFNSLVGVQRYLKDITRPISSRNNKRKSVKLFISAIETLLVRSGTNIGESEEERKGELR